MRFGYLIERQNAGDGHSDPAFRNGGCQTSGIRTIGMDSEKFGRDR